MLASPLLPTAMFSTQSSADEPLHFRPARDLDTFKSLLPPPIDFIEGSSSGTLAVAEGKYEPINASPTVSKAEPPDDPKSTPIPPIPQPSQPHLCPSRSTATKSAISLHPEPIDLTWPQSCNQGSGLYNSGNTCFINSALQCLLHTPPLLRLLVLHRKDACPISHPSHPSHSPSFCMTCNLRLTAVKAFKAKTPFSPSDITDNLKVIAKHMRKGRQEDTHEFLRYAIDSLQKSCLVEHAAKFDAKVDAKVAETTWVHKLFGGRLRSRVTCRDCGHNSDTFDRILDLSLDIFRCDSLRDALRKFVNIDHLKGADKYKCEKCKKHVDAEKQFTIHEAPQVLTVHLKRFTPLGRKISHPLQYDEELALRPFMSAGAFGPTYSLYGVICHAGGGPNSGHYYSYVKSREGNWLEMNDETVAPSGVPVNKKNAYMLFYIQKKGQGLDAAVKAPLLGIKGPGMKNGLAASMKKKVQRPKDAEEDTGVKVDTKFIGPLLPSAEITPTKSPSTPTSPVDPQAASLKAKIEAVSKRQPSQAPAPLVNYDSDHSSGKENEIQRPSNGSGKEDVKDKPMEDPDDVVMDNATTPRPSSPSPSGLPAFSPSFKPSAAISVDNFYSNSNGNLKKRKLADNPESNITYQRKKYSSPLQSRTNGYMTSNPFNRPINKKRRIGL